MALAFPTVKNTEFKLVGEGLYLASLKDVGEPRESESALYGKSTQVRLIWSIEQVLDGEEDNEDSIGEEVWEYCTWSLGKKAKLRTRLEALLGRTLEEGEELNVSDVLGKRVKLNVVHYEKNDGTQGQKVASAVAYKAKKRRQVIEEDDDDSIPF